jgi:hypothetical protein
MIIISPNVIYRLVFLVATGCILCEVGTEIVYAIYVTVSLTKVKASFLAIIKGKIQEQLFLCMP